MGTLGSVPATGGGLQPSRAQASPIGIGLQTLAKGIDGLGGAMADMASAQLTSGQADMSYDNAVRTRDEKLAKAKLTVDFTKLQGQWARDSIDIENNLDPQTQNYDEVAQPQLTQRLDDFLATVPENLLPTFKPLVEEYKQNETTGIKIKKYGIQGKQYNANLADLKVQAMDSILLGKKSALDWEPILDDYFSNSPYDKITTEALRKDTLRSLQESEAFITARDEYKNPEANYAVQGGINGVSPQMNGFMGLIVQKESGGKANSMYTPDPKNPRSFSDFSQHPNQAVPVPGTNDVSTAAGLVGFIKGTWDRAQNALKLENFSPENQIRGALFIARDDYKRRTGRNLDSDLASGDPQILKLVKDNLTPTWDSLRHVSLDEFIQSVEHGRPVQSSIINDPTYSELGVADRMAIAEKALEAANKDRQTSLALQQQQLAAARSQLEYGVMDGSKNDKDIWDFARSNSLPAEDTRQLLDLRKEYQAQQVSIEKFTSALTTPGAVFDEAAKKGFDTFYQKEGKGKLIAGDEEYVNNGLIPAIKQSQYLPPDVVATLGGMVQSRDPQQAKFAYETLARLQVSAPMQYNAGVTDELKGQLQFYQSMSDYLPDNTRIQELQARNTPEGKQRESIIKENIAAVKKDNPTAFLPQTIMSNMGSQAETLDPMMASSIATDFSVLYERESLRYGDHDKAYAAALKILGTRYQDFSIGDHTYFMKNPPQALGVPTINESYNWLDRVVRKDLKLASDTKYELRADTQTETEAGKGDPSYMVWTEQAPGIYLPLLNDKNMPTRVGFMKDYRLPDNKTAAVEGALWYRREEALSPLMAFAFQASNVAETTPTSSEVIPDASKFYGLLGLAAKRIAATKPEHADDFGRQSGLQDYSPPEISTADTKRLLKKFGYESLDAFIYDLPTMDQNDIETLLREADK